MIHHDPILACVIKQYGTGVYRAYASLNKGHTVCLSAHSDEESANETIYRFQEACREGTIRTAEDALRFVGSLVAAKGENLAPMLREEELSLAA